MRIVDASLIILCPLTSAGSPALRKILDATTRMECTMSPLPRALAVLLSVCLPAAAQAEPVSFTNVGDFYRSLGGALFPESGTSLAMPCTESPRHCIWVTSMHQALRRYDPPLWTTPGDLPMTPPKGVLDVAFDGQTLMVGTRRWPLSRAVNLTSPQWRSETPIDPENLTAVTAWQRGTSVCLDMRYSSSGTAVRYTAVLLLHGERLYTLPPLFATCAAIREAPHDGFSYPSNTYLGAEQEHPRPGLQVDYVLSDGKTRIARYVLHFADQGNPYRFEATRGE
ncbi:hypothetical protein [Stenotrophomonas sp. TWI809]|uniref:hypothetical protein n=1 Tax=Stenotrophomonas sp. TWI809 TaxID=3136796 RepID=UPI003207EB8A